MEPLHSIDTTAVGIQVQQWIEYTIKSFLPPIHGLCLLAMESTLTSSNNINKFLDAICYVLFFYALYYYTKTLSSFLFYFSLLFFTSMMSSLHHLWCHHLLFHLFILTSFLLINSTLLRYNDITMLSLHYDFTSLYL